MRLLQSIVDDLTERDDHTKQLVRGEASEQSEKLVSVWQRKSKKVAEGRWGSEDMSSLSKGAFKRRELEFELGHEDRAGRNTFTASHGEIGTFFIIVDGERLQKHGQEVRFFNSHAANAAAETIRRTHKDKTVKVKMLEGAHSVTEDEEMQALGKELKASKKDEPAQVQALSTAPKAISDDELKVGDKVVPLSGPHKGVEHEVTEVRPNGVIIKPIGLADAQVKYTKGKGAEQAHSALAKPEQLERVKANESLFTMVAKATK